MLMRDADGKVVTDRRVTWSVQGPATLGTDTTVRISEPAGVTVTATAEGKVGVGHLTAQPLRFASISAGTGYTCGLVAGGWVYCWGVKRGWPAGRWRSGTEDGTHAGPAVPAFRNVAAGSRMTCALDLDGHPYCWGRNQWSSTLAGLFL